MPSSIDERIVQMTFNNRQFESGVSETLQTLNKLKAATAFKGGTSGLDSLGAAAQSVQNKFSVMGTVIDQTLRNITNQVEAVAAKMVSSITTQPIKDGFAEYETQMNAVQTILANTQSKGTTLDQVNDALDELNVYADKTIYNFTQMTENISRFTAAGIGLNTSVKAIQGIANLAAVSGSNTHQASMAMYQLSQALASGTVKLVDWNSVVNAGMGGKVFQDALIRTSEHLQTGAKAAIAAEGSFRDSLSEGWLTTKVLTETLNQFAVAVDTEEQYSAAIKKFVEEGYTEEEAKAIADMAKTAADAATKVKTFSMLIDTLKEALGSGWTQSWETIIGDFEEAKELWTGVNDILSTFVNASSNARNQMLEEWKEFGGRSAILRSISNLFYGLLSVIVPVSQAFRDIFPATTGKRLAEITKSIEKLTEHFYLAKSSSEGLKNTFRGLFAAVDIVWQAFKALVTALLPVGTTIEGIVGETINCTGVIGEWLVQIDESIKKNNTFGRAIQKVQAFFEPFTKGIKGVAEAISNLLGPAFEEIANTDIEVPIPEGVLGRITERLQILTPVVQTFGRIFSALGRIFQSVAPILTSVMSSLGTIVATGLEQLANSIASANFSSIFDVINTGIESAILLEFNEMFKFANKKLGVYKNRGGSKKKSSGSGSGSGGTKKQVSYLEKLLGAFTDGTAVNNAIAALSQIKSALLDTFTALQENLKAKTLNELSIAIGLITASIVALSFIDSNKLAASLAGVGAAMAELSLMMKYLNGFNFGSKSLFTAAAAMIPIAIAIGLLSGAVVKLGALDFGSLAKGLVGTIAIMVSLAKVTESLAQKAPQMSKGATSMILMGVAVNILASAVKKLGELSLGQIVKGLVALDVVIGEIELFLENGRMGKLGITTGVGLIAFAAGLKIMASAVNDLGSLGIEKLAVGLIGMGVALFAISKAVDALPKTTALIGLGLITFASGLVIMAGALKILGSMSLTEAAISLGALGVALYEIQAGISAMSSPKLLVGAAAMLIVAPAILVLASALRVLGTMDLMGAASTLVVLGGSLYELAVGLSLMGNVKVIAGGVALGVAAAGLALLVPQLLLLSGLTLGQVVTTLIALGGALTILAIGMDALLPSIPALLSLSVAMVALGIGALGIGVLVAQLVLLGALPLGNIIVSVVALAAVVTGLAVAATLLTPTLPALFSMAGAILALGAASLIAGAGLALAGVGLSSIAATGADAGAVIGSIVSSLIELLPKVVTGLKEFAVAAIDAIVEIVPKLLSAIESLVPKIVKSVASIITQVLQVLADYIPSIVTAAVNFIVAFVNTIADNLGTIIQAAITLAISFINGLADGLRNNSDAVAKAIINLMDAVIESLLTFVKDFIDAGADFVAGLIDGIWEGIESVGEAAAGLGAAAVDAICSLLDINSPSEVLRQIGLFFGLGFEEGIEDSEDGAVTAAEGLAEASTDAMYDEEGAAAAGAANAAAYNSALNATLDRLDGVDSTTTAGALDEKLALKNQNRNSSIKGNNGNRFEEDYGGDDDWLSRIRKLAAGNSSATNSTYDLEDATEELTAATDANTDSTGSNSKSKSSSSKSTEKTAKELKEAQKVTEKFTKYSVASIAATQKAFDDLFGTADKTTNNLGVAQDAVIALAEQIYAASLKASDDISEVGDTTEEVSESSQEHIQKIMEAFNKQFETYKDNVKNAMDLYERFDNQISDATKPADVLKNAKSQIEGYTFLAQKYMLLANRGVSRTILAELEEEGTSALPKINSMLKMSDSQLKEYITDLENVDAVSSAVAGQMMAAQAVSNTVSVWRKQAASQSKLTTKMRNDYADYINQMKILSYKSVEGTNLLFEETLDETHAGTVKVLDESGKVIKEQTIDIQAAIARLATDAKNAGIECDDMMKALGDTAATEATAALQLVDAYTKAARTVVLYNEYLSDMKNTVKDTIESQLDLFDELELKTDLTSKEVLKNLESQVKGMQKWAAEYQAIAARGLNDEILAELAELGPEGYEKLHAFYTMSDAELAKANALYTQRLTVTESVSTMIGQSYAAAAVGGMTAYTNALKLYMGENSEYNAAMQSLSTNAKSVLQTTMATVGQEAAQTLTTQLGSSIAESSSTVTTAASQTAADAANAAKTTISNKSSELTTEATNAGIRTTAGYGSNVNTANGKKQTNWYIDGIISGFEQKADAVYEAAYAVGAAADKGTHDGMGNGSPSWKGAQQALWYLMGVANGLKDMSGSVENTAYDSGSMIAAALNQALVAESELGDDMTLHPTISPVVDLSDAQNGANDLAALLGNGYGMNLSPNLGRITTDADRMNSLMGRLNGSGNMTYGDTNLYVYGTQGQNVSQLADIVIKKLNNEYSRRKATWA